MLAPSSLLAACLLTAALPAQEKWPWPPPGAEGQWQTDMEAALRRAQRERKPLMVYIATANCPHCKVLTKTVWPTRQALEACARVVCVAIHRYQLDPKKPRSHPPTPWAIRFDVMGYPQFRFLDAWGRPLPVSDRVVRTPAGLAAAIDRAVRAMAKTQAPKAQPGDELRIPGHLAGSGDPIRRLEVLDALAKRPRDDDSTAVLADAVRWRNDYVRQRALQMLPTHATPERAAELCAWTMDRVLSKESGWRNPNNMLIAAVAASRHIALPSLIAPLTRVIESSTGNNYATFASVQALVAIKSRHPQADVSEAFEAALKIEGAYQKRIRELMPAAERQVAPKRIAGGPGDFLQVEHLKLRGSNAEIGARLAKLAKQRYGYAPFPAADPLRARAQRQWFARNYPIFLERMEGVAAAFGKKVDDDGFLFSTLFYNAPAHGCSVTYYPPKTTATGTGVLSRYYDFSTGTLRGTPPPEGQLAATARPWLLELHPDKGYASLAMVSYDLLGVIDGINSEGLTVALLADDELIRLGIEPNQSTTAGLGVLLAGRMLLDTCKDVEEAKVALLASKHYYSFIPCHYIVCDRHGRSFVWEHSRQRNREHIVDGGGEVQVTTNFMLHRYPKAVPKGFGRFHALKKRIAAANTKLTLDDIRSLHSCVAATRGTATPTTVVGRTLWHAIYLPERRAVQIDYYLGDKNGKVRRSGYTEVRLER